MDQWHQLLLLLQKKEQCYRHSECWSYFKVWSLCVLTPLFIYTRDDSGAQIVRGGSTFTIVAGIFSICALICYLICYKLTTERVRIDQSQYKVSLLKSLKGLVKNRALLSIIGAAIFLLLAQLLIMSMNNYVFPDYNDAQGIVIKSI